MDKPEIEDDQIFLFKKENGEGGAATTHEELTQWVISKLPPPSAYAWLRKISKEELKSVQSII